MGYRTDAPQSVMRPADSAICGGALSNPAHNNVLARELVSDSRVLIEHARLIVRNSTSRIDRIEKRLDAAGKLVSALIASRLDRREAA